MEFLTFHADIWKLVSNRPKVDGIPYVRMESKEIPYVSMESKEIPYVSMESKEIPYVTIESKEIPYNFLNMAYLCPC
jgi:ribosomal protein L7Ae-like RNA K-turn-binding protein